jgi:hypothetical protein
VIFVDGSCGKEIDYGGGDTFVSFLLLIMITTQRKYRSQYIVTWIVMTANDTNFMLNYPWILYRFPFVFSPYCGILD